LTLTKKKRTIKEEGEESEAEAWLSPPLLILIGGEAAGNVGV
jgi:hypothetical protein